MRILVSIGSESLFGRAEEATTATHQRKVISAAEVLASLDVAHEVVVAHGGEPQADGVAGKMLELALRNALPDRDLMTVHPEVVVSAQDPAFDSPSKPIGPTYSEEEAEQLAAQRGWSMGRQAGGFRRLLPSPEPQAIVELRSLRTLIDAGTFLICAGGDGIPVALNGDGAMHGVDAVVDEHLTAALLARRLDADLLVIAAETVVVHVGPEGEDERIPGIVTPAGLRDLNSPPRSTWPKLEAACRFVEATGRRAAIGELRSVALDVLRGQAGARVSASRA
jgi:carbamate kinase